MLKSKGFLVAVEGIDGSGKSSLVKNLSIALTQKNHAVLTTKEPGGTELGKALREILNARKGLVESKSEYLLFAADRAQHFATLVLPALAQGKIVISDRTGDSSIAYQGYGRGLDRNIMQTVNAWAMENRKPDLVLYVRLDAETAYKRVLARNDKLTSFETEALEFWKRVGAGFDEMYAGRNDVLILDGTMTQETICEIALERVLSDLK